MLVLAVKVRLYLSRMRGSKMRIKKQLEIMKEIDCKTEEQITGFEATLASIQLGDKFLYRKIVGRGCHTRYEDAHGINTLLKVLKVQSTGNIADRGGKWGDYVVFSDTKENRDAIEFIKGILKIMVEYKED